MCGIVGILDFSRLQDMEGSLRRMLGIIRHRGPDAFGIYTNNKVGLGSTRLSIIDLNSGDQPIHNEDRTVWVVFNGEIFNYPEIRRSLESKGHRFYTESDTEVLVHLYEDHGPDMLEVLNFRIYSPSKSRSARSLCRPIDFLFRINASLPI